jgi:hypothetical protein
MDAGRNRPFGSACSASGLAMAGPAASHPAGCRAPPARAPKKAYRPFGDETIWPLLFT